MSSIVVSGDTSGTVTLQAPAVAGSTVLTLPVATDTLVGKATTDVLTNKTLGAGLVAGASILTSGTAVASTSGTSIDFTGIPSWTKRITVMFNGVSTNGTSNIQVQIGSGSVDTSGYNSIYGVGAGSTIATSGFLVTYTTAAGYLRIGNIILNLLSSNTWVESGLLGDYSNAGATTSSQGSKTTSGALDRVRITTVNGTDTFDAGSINIMYE